MSDQVTTNLYPIGKPSDNGPCSHGWFVVTLDQQGNALPDTPPVLALPLPLPDNAVPVLTIAAQAESLTLRTGDNVLAVIDCRGSETEVLQILASGRLGLIEVGADFRLQEGMKLPVAHKAQIDMQPFHDDHQHRLTVMQAHDPDLHQQQLRIFEAMPAYIEARKIAASRPAPVEISAEDKTRIWSGVMGNRQSGTKPASDGQDILKAALKKARSSDLSDE